MPTPAPRSAMVLAGQPMSAISEGNLPTKAWKQQKYGQDWVIGDTINASIGQGYVLTSPLHLAVMTARLATGRAVEPRLVRRIGTQDVPEAEAPSLGLDRGNLSRVLQGMHEVVNGAQ